MSLNQQQLKNLATQIKLWGKELGFNQVGICDLNLSAHEDKLTEWLNKGFHGEMEYMAKYGLMRARPAELHPGSIRAISVRMDYLPEHAQFAQTLKQTDKAYVSRYAIGRDYHKVLRNKLKQLGQKIEQQTELNTGFRPFVDSAPIMERPLAEKAGLGWVGKHSLVLDENAGSWFFLGELLINLPLPVDEPVKEQCGSCVACMTLCPTNAIVAPYEVDARKCISYLTIELQGEIPLEFRQLIGNRIYGCDDCQLACPWNRYAQLSQEQDFKQRHGLLSQDLLTLWHWDEKTFLDNTQGSPIRRIGYQRWQRNLAIGLGNADFSPAILNALQAKLTESSELVKNHINWAIEQQTMKQIHAQSSQSKQVKRLVRVIEKGLPRDA
ncbi:tRNA epoxyqueuosine(34) reductase QueG [Catenovulum sp. 2E275]|uniref:tRNA epoxyqueuosine(34) reductase QueG n=1 Tax=Catenovulum sp. 2E275 TaxID=2980497 RepID=UPI0021D0A022|nr:tRNA epoxyqueuosine(34) reductase QueG [Catenovulum sp. 2E275]MCU4676344.1 tRNA epoxyqueuosine(34) reductase QueG [Catenovulum sp. 2E275]